MRTLPALSSIRTLYAPSTLLAFSKIHPTTTPAAYNPLPRVPHLSVAVLNCDNGFPANASAAYPLAAQPLANTLLGDERRLDGERRWPLVSAPRR